MLLYWVTAGWLGVCVDGSGVLLGRCFVQGNCAGDDDADVDSHNNDHTAASQLPPHVGGVCFAKASIDGIGDQVVDEHGNRARGDDDVGDVAVPGMPLLVRTYVRMMRGQHAITHANAH